MRTHSTRRGPRARGLSRALALAVLSLPLAAEEESVVIHADRVLVRPGQELEDVSILVQRGRIVAVGHDLEVPEGARELEGAVVCAGFIDPWSSFALDPGAVGDGGTSAATRSADALDPYLDARRVAEVLRSGVVTVRTQAGNESRVGGLGALVRLPVEDGEAAVLLDDSVLAMRVGTGRTAGDPFAEIDDVDRIQRAVSDGNQYLLEQNEYRHELEEWRSAIAKKEAELEKDFKKAKKDREKEIEKAKEKGKEYKEKRYKEDKKPRAPRYDPDKEVLARVADGRLPLVVEVNSAAAIRELLAATEEFGRLRLILAGGAESLALADRLAERHIPVIVAPHPVGSAERDQYSGGDLALAGRLARAGVHVLIGSGDGVNALETRDLPLMAGLAVGHGLEREKAFEALTIGAARALDVADRIGTVERGKDADLLVLSGDPLDATTRVEWVLSHGRVVITPEEAGR